MANGNEIIMGAGAGGGAEAGLCGRRNVEVRLPGAAEAAGLVCGDCFGRGPRLEVSEGCEYSAAGSGL